MDFPKMDFPESRITSTNCFRDTQLIQEIHQMGSASAYLPKVEKTYGKIIFPPGEQYPYTYGSIALSMDGKMAYPDNTDGDMLVHSNTLDPDGALADFFVLNFLRAYSDAVMVGTNSMKAEANEWITIYDEELCQERLSHMPEKDPQPFTIVSSKDGTDIPFDHILFNQDRLPVLVFTSPVGYENIQKAQPGRFFRMTDITRETIRESTGKNPVVVTGQGDQTDLIRFMALMKGAGVDHMLIESPMLMWLLMKEKLLNEFFMTYSSIFVGGHMSPGFFAPFTFEEHPQSRMMWVNHHQNNFLYVRQTIEAAK